MERYGTKRYAIIVEWKKSQGDPALIFCLEKG